MGNALILSQIMGVWLDKLMQMNTMLQASHASGVDLTDKQLEELFMEDDLASTAGRQAIKDARANAATK